MTQYYDAGIFREKRNGGWYFVKLGSAKPNDKGGMTVFLDALPLQDSAGRCALSIVPQKERDQSSPGSRQISDSPDSRSPNFDDSPPF